jgi:hypothetical protein
MPPSMMPLHILKLLGNRQALPHTVVHHKGNITTHNCIMNIMDTTEKREGDIRWIKGAVM